jgi:hypothetical protein
MSHAIGFGSLRSRLQERRRNPRLTTQFDATLSASAASIPVRGVNIDRRGACVLCDEPLTPGSMLFLRLDNVRLMGFAYVRHCSAV